MFELPTPHNLIDYSCEHHQIDLFSNEPGAPYNFFPYQGGFFESLKFFYNADCDHQLQSRNPKNDFSNQTIEGPNNETIRCWNIGHATILIQINNFFIITDPIFDSCASPVPGFILRSVPAACSIDELPPIDFILLSHSHYDHMNKPSIQNILKKNPKCLILCPLLLGQRFLSSWKVNSFIEFDWRQHLIFHKRNDQLISISPEQYDKSEVNNCVEFICLPARHGSARTGFDADQVLWCSWLIKFNNKISIYFPGDTAVGPHFADIYEIRNQKRPLDLFLCPIGPQEPWKMMRNVHLDGKEAKQMSKNIHANVVVPIHHGVFPLGFKPEKTDLQIAIEAWQDTEGEDPNNVNELIPWKIGGRVDWNHETQRFVVTDLDQIFDTSQHYY